MSVKFTLKDEPQVYELRFDFNALAEAEAATQTNLMAAIGSWPGLAAGQARALLYALLKPAHPEVLVAEAGGLFTKDMAATWRALKASLVEASLLQVEEEAAPAAKDAVVEEKKQE